MFNAADFIEKHGINANDLLVTVDMQVDFKDGALGTDRAVAISPDIAALVAAWPGKKAFTKDTHGENYLETQEGRYLNIIHTVKDTPGWEIIPEIKSLMTPDDLVFEKSGFGSWSLAEYLRSNHFRRIFFAGVCTGICVLSNVVAAKTADKEAVIYVIDSLCGCVCSSSHKIAIQAMELIQVQII